MKKRILQFAIPALFIACAATVFSSCKKEDTDLPLPDPEFRKEILLSPFPDVYSGSKNNKGQLLSLSPEGDTIWKKDFTTGVHDFKRWVINRELRYSYIEIDAKSADNPMGSLPGTAVILDKDFNEIKRVNLLPYDGRTESDQTQVDGHDFILLGDNHYIVMAYYTKKVTNIPVKLSPNPNCNVVLNIVQEVKDGTVVWEWNSSKHPELYEASVEGNNFKDDTKPQDYLHMNSMFVDPKDNNLICSFRNTDMVFKINRTMGNIMWRLGGSNGDFPLANNQLFYKQHHATLADNNETLLIFDNGDVKNRRYSRILEYKLDETAKKVTGFKSYTLPSFCEYMGSVQKTESTYFIGGGSTPMAWEVDLATGRVTWSKSLASNSYRVYKY